MPIPGQSVTIIDPGLGVTEVSGNTALCLGTAESGTVNTMYSLSNKADVISTFGQGPLSEIMCRICDEAGGPVLGMRLNGSVAGSAGAVTKTAVGTSTGTVTVAGAVPYNRYEVTITILSTGALGVATFKFSLDDGRTDSEQIVVPSGGTYAIPNTNITLTFVAGAGPVIFEAGDRHEFDTIAPHFGTADLGTASTAIQASNIAYQMVFLAGRSTSAANAATMFAAFATMLTALKTQFRFVRGMMDVGGDTPTNVITAFANQVSDRICATFDDIDISSSKAVTGYGAPKTAALYAFASRAAASLPSTDLMRVASGPILGALEISHDERRTEVLDQNKISTTRTWVNIPGFFFTNARLKSGVGSDFQYWQHGRVMDLACTTVVQAHAPFIGRSFRANPGTGTIHEKDALAMETTVRDILTQALMVPLNAEGTPGYVSAFAYNILRTNNIITTGILYVTIAVLPLAYVKFISTTIGFSLNVGGEA